MRLYSMRRNKIVEIQLVGALWLLASGCQSSFEPSDELDATYFPPTEFSDLESWQSNLPERFSGYLRDAGEPVIYNDASIGFAARLTLHTAFNGTLVVAVQQMEDGATLGRVKQFAPYDGRSRKTIGNLIDSRHIPISEQNIIKLRNIATQTDFWTEDNKQELVGSDGSYWILEVKDGERYHAAYKWWPSDGPIYEIGALLMDTADVDFEDR